MKRNVVKYKGIFIRTECSVSRGLFQQKEGGILSKEAITRVLSAEAEANAIRERARTEAAERIAACEVAVAAASADAVARTVSELKSREASVRTRAEALILQSREEAEGDIEALRAVAQDKMREAVKHIEWELCDI